MTRVGNWLGTENKTKNIFTIENMFSHLTLDTDEAEQESLVLAMFYKQHHN